VLSYGTSNDCDVRLTDAALDPETLSTRFRVQTPTGTILGTLSSPGLHLALNACAAIAVGVALRVPPETMAARLSRYEPVGMRMLVETTPDGTRVFNDAYNANPISMESSLRTLAALSRPRLALLGDMLELGAAEAQEHRRTLDLALSADLGLDHVGVAGPAFERAAAERGPDPRLTAAPDAPTLLERVRLQLDQSRVVLVKGSRGMAMERIVHELLDGGSA
jgi:UDP-N-acetylmuramyl pentapeptide synthase